jgi:hypothetical protein
MDHTKINARFDLTIHPGLPPRSKLAIMKVKPIIRFIYTFLFLYIYIPLSAQQKNRDMIRFGTWFTGTWKFKTTVTPDFRKTASYTRNRTDANTALKQNPGYN